MLRPYHPCQIETIPNPTCFFSLAYWHIVALPNCQIDLRCQTQRIASLPQLYPPPQLPNWQIVSLSNVLTNGAVGAKRW